MIDLGYGAWFRNHDDALPIFHRIPAWPGSTREWFDDDGREHHGYVAVCGLLLEEWSFVRGVDGSHRDGRRALVMRLIHAEKFGRQCRSCTRAIDRA